MGNDNCTGRSKKNERPKHNPKGSSELQSSMLLSSQQTELQNPYARSGVSGGSGNLDESLDTNSLESDAAVLNSPLHNYETFERYIAHLNKQLQLNMPFLKAKFGVTAISIYVALKEGGILTDNMRRLWFAKGVSKTTVLV